MMGRSVWSAAAVVVMCLIGAVPMTFAQAATEPALDGEWKVALHGGHVIPVGMALKQDRDAVTGVMHMWNGDIELEGQFVSGTLKVTGTHAPADGGWAGEWTVTATLLPNGTLEGTFAHGQRGGMKLTAERFNARAARRRPGPAAAPPPGMMTLAGKWDLNARMGDQGVKFDLDIAVKGDQITGHMFVDHAGKMELKDAKFADGVLTFAVAVAGSPAETRVSARLLENQTLEGELNGAMGKVSFTGQRAK